MKKFDFAIEKVFRFFEKDVNNLVNINESQKYMHNFECYVVQFAIEKPLLLKDIYYFNIVQKNNSIKSIILFRKKLFFIPQENKVIDELSHEDPLIETENHYLACFQIPPEYLHYLNEEITISFTDKNEKIILEQDFNNLFTKFGLNKNDNLYSKIEDNYILTTQKDCILRVHVGNENALYHEEEYIFKENTQFNFKKYLLNNTYIGLQCSYENEPTELEEKYIMIGQKGMTNSYMYFDGKDYHYALLPFETKYQKLYYKENIEINNINFVSTQQEHWNEVNNINELIIYIENNSEKIHFFETTREFIEVQYKKVRTHGIGKTYNKAILKSSFHIDTPICKDCSLSAKCMQLIPSSLSFNQYKNVIALEKPEDCKIYSLIKKYDKLHSI